MCPGGCKTKGESYVGRPLPSRDKIGRFDRNLRMIGQFWPSFAYNPSASTRLERLAGGGELGGGLAHV